MVRPLPFQSNSFDEIHAYEVLEHTGAQGDAPGFFAEWEEYWRMLKPDGMFCATVPAFNSPWAWGDPSHRRVITEGTLAFLSQAEYVKQVGRTAMSDFRHVYHADFEKVWCATRGDSMYFVLRAVKE